MLCCKLILLFLHLLKFNNEVKMLTVTDRNRFFFLVFRDRVSLYSPGYSGHSVDQAGLELRNPPASASRVLGLECATMHGLEIDP